MTFHRGFLGQPRPARSWEYLGTYPAGGQPVILIDGLTPRFSRYRFELDGMRPSVDSTQLQLLLGQNGALIAGTAYRYHLMDAASDSALYVGAAGSGVSAIILAGNVGSAVGRAYMGTVEMFQPKIDEVAMVFSDGTAVDGGGNVRNVRCSAFAAGIVGPVDRAAFQWSSSGLFMAGEIHVYGAMRVAQNRRTPA